jgi:DNA polymerase IV
MGNLCRDCFVETAPGALRCTHCHGKRLISHRSWRTLTIAHIDCDAFYAAIEKRENPTLKNKPVIVGGGHRGVVATCCYIARLSGVKSAMPMFKALALCPQAVVIKPNMALYAQVSKQMRAMLNDLSPAIEQISIDEAFIDMTGTAQVHKSPPAKILAQFQHHVEKTLGISISIGLAPNKFLAKFASDLDKPRGFSLIDAEEAPHILAPLPITRIAGIGAATARKLNARGVESVADLQALDIKSAFQLLGSDANHWIERAWGRDARTVTNERIRKSLSAERTFDTDNFRPSNIRNAFTRRRPKSWSRFARQIVSGNSRVSKSKNSRLQNRYSVPHACPCDGIFRRLVYCKPAALEGFGGWHSLSFTRFKCRCCRRHSSSERTWSRSFRGAYAEIGKNSGQLKAPLRPKNSARSSATAAT